MNVRNISMIAITPMITATPPYVFQDMDCSKFCDRNAPPRPIEIQASEPSIHIFRFSFL